MEIDPLLLLTAEKLDIFVRLKEVKKCSKIANFLECIYQMDLQTFNDEFLPSSLIGLSVVKIVNNQFILTGIGLYFKGGVFSYKTS